MAAQPLPLTHHIESFVDSSRSPTQKAASLDAIVSLLKNDVVDFRTLVREMESYLTTTDNVIRARGILLLGEAIARLSSKPLSDATVHSLIIFFSERLADWRALRGALVGCLALMRRKSRGTVSTSDVKAVAESYLPNLEVQSLAQHDRKLCLELLECLLGQYPEVVAPLGDDLIYGVCAAIDGEKDPECLMITFHIVEVLVQIFSDPGGPLASFAADIFSILGCYFPIHFTHPKAEDVVKRDDLSKALMYALSSTPLFEPFVIPLLLEKLSSSLTSAKVDSLKYLSYCMLKYGADKMTKYAGSIWSSLKDTLYSSGEDLVFPFTLESLDHLDFRENELVTEALLLLEKVIIQNNEFSSLIIDDEEINMVFNTITSYNNCNEVTHEIKKKLHVVGRILYVSAKASFASCNSIFQSFFLPLMGTLGISIDDASTVSYPNDDFEVSKVPNYGSFFLCIELLQACRDLMKGSEDLTSQHISPNETSFHLVQRFSNSLTKIFSSTLAMSADESKLDADMYLGVKGLQTLATFSGGFSFVSKLTFENILVTLISIITNDFNKTLLWKMALKALGNIGSFVQECDETEKVTSYIGIAVERIVSLASSDDFSMPFQLKLEALSNIGTSGQKYMLKILQGLEEVICANLSEVYVHGNVKSAETVLHVFQCYSNKLLPWIQKNEDYEEILVKLVINMWNQIENCKAFTLGVHAKDLFDATMKVMKLAVASCSVKSQSKIVDKSLNVLSLSTFPLKESLSVTLEELDTAQGIIKFSTREEWIYSLLASVIISLHPQTRVPNMKEVLHLFIIILLKGSSSAAQALGSVVNKLSLKSNGGDMPGDCTIEEAIDIIFNTSLWSSCHNGSFERGGRMSNGNDSVLTKFCLGTTNRSLQIHAITGLAWIGKGLLMRGHEKVKDITMVFLDCLLSNGGVCIVSSELDSAEKNSEQGIHSSVVQCAADAFQILMSDSEHCLNRRFHATIRPLYKQRFYSTMMPILQSLINKSNSPFSRSMLYRAFAHVISDTPLSVILSDAKKITAQLLDGLTLLSKDVGNKDIVYSILLVLSGILTDKNGQEAVLENVNNIITCLIQLVAYCHMMLVRETAIQCLLAMSELPRARIHSMEFQVIQATTKALDDPKRAVRQEAVKCRHAWASLASLSLGLHF